MKKVFSKREGKVEFRVWKYEGGEWNCYPAYEIVAYQSNWFYYHKDDFIEDPDQQGSMVRKTDKPPYFSHVSKSCFENEESCLTIAFFDVNTDGDHIEGYELRYVSDRPVSVLTTEDDADFNNIVRYAYNYLRVELDKEKYEED